MLRKAGFILLVTALGANLAGCGKKQVSEELMQEPVSMESLSAMSVEPIAAGPGIKEQAKPPITVSQAALEPLPPSGPYRPSISEIQTALKNSGYYAGNIDGKSGPMTKKATEDFQKANGLEADGKVGPKTWVLLSRYLSGVPMESKGQ